MKHKHADAIIAWANGAVVQIKLNTNAPWRINYSPQWYEEYEYRASLAFVEGKPVFAGDVLYLKDGDLMWNAYSWNPPKPATITVTIPRPNYPVVMNSSECVVINGDAFAIAKAINEAMK